MKRFFRRALKAVGIFFLAIFALAFVRSFFAGPPKSPTAEEAAALAEKERVAEVRRQAEELAKRQQDLEEKQEETRIGLMIHSQEVIKASLRDPSSLAWEKILSNDDGSVMCFVYRARNGFGGMNQDVVVLANNKYTHGIQAWNKNCKSKPMIDMDKYRF